MVESYIFCINAGRSGSEYLAYLLNSSKECRCFHERYPNFAGYAIQKVNSEGFDKTIDFQMLKINAILTEQIDRPIYGDTSHLFIKSWFMAAAKKLSNVKVIWLLRDKEEVIRSMLRLKSIPDRSINGQNWYLRSSYRYNLLAAKQNMSDEENCRWYVNEIEKRAEFFIRKFPHIPVYKIMLNDLNDKINVAGFFQQLGLTFTEQTDALIGNRRNLKLPQKRDFLVKIYLRVKRRAISLNPFRNRKRIHITGSGYYV